MAFMKEQEIKDTLQSQICCLEHFPKVYIYLANWSLVSQQTEMHQPYNIEVSRKKLRYQSL